MEFSKLEQDLAIIAKLDDEPNDVGGLSAEELKAKFDEAGKAIQQYINETLLPQLAADTAAAALGAVLNGEATTIQEAIDVLRAASLQSGNVPTGGAAGEYLRKRTDDLYDLAWTRPFTRFEFTAEDWRLGEDGLYTLTVAKADHARQGEAFGCFLRHEVDGVMYSNTWAVLGTQSAYDGALSAIVLTSPDPYGGVALFYDEGQSPSL